MKKYLLLLCLLLTPCYVMSQPTSSSTLKTADATILDDAGQLCGVFVNTDGATKAVVEVFNCTASCSGAGSSLFKIDVIGADEYGGVMFPNCIGASTGIWVDETDVESYFILYRK